MYVVLAASIAVTIWFAIGGFADLRYLFNKLKSVMVDPLDDGRVRHNCDDSIPSEFTTTKKTARPDLEHETRILKMS